MLRSEFRSRFAGARAAARRSACALAGLALAVASSLPARADERGELEQLRATTLALIEVLVNQGMLSRERAEALLKQAAPRPPAGPGWGAPLPGASASAPAGNVIRVPYVSETVRAQIRDEIRNDVFALAREERWADPRALPEWLRGLAIEGDVRVRYQNERYPDARLGPGGPCDLISGNLPAECYRDQTLTPAWAPDQTNTTIDRERLTLRARLGVLAKVSDDTQAGVRLSTGTNSGPTSASQTLGSHFNRTGVTLDRAFVRWEPRYDFRVIAGRIANPFFGSDLLWPDDLSFDGVALQAERNVMAGGYAFATLGAFPLEEFNVGKRDKWLYAFQVGGDFAIDSYTQWRLGVALYDFSRVEGVRETEPPPGGPRAGAVPYFQSQYPTNVRLKGNTLINLNDPTSTAAPTWGLASKFRPVNVSSAITLKQFDPVHVGVHLDWVRNGAFDLADIRRRAGVDTLDDLSEKTTGVQARVTAGMPALANSGDWLVFAAYRKFERDSWIDGFTDTTWHLGGTNYRGWQIGGLYAFDRRTSLGLRVTSTENLNDGRPTLAVPGVPGGIANRSNAPLQIDVFQVDLNTRF